MTEQRAITEDTGRVDPTAAIAPGGIIVAFDIDGVVRDVGGSYRRALADTVEHFTRGAYRPSPEEIDRLKGEGVWNNDWEASRELVYRHFEAQGLVRGVSPDQPTQCLDNCILVNYEELVAFFQQRYRGTDPVHWNGYICEEPLLLSAAYLETLTQAGVLWGFFSGATTGSARYVLEKRLGLTAPVLVAMEDAPGKPDPTGLFQTIALLQPQSDESTPVIYVGDTVADMYTVVNAKQLYPHRPWIGVGVLPPHVQESPERKTSYGETLTQAGAAIVLENVEGLTPDVIKQLAIAAA